MWEIFEKIKEAGEPTGPSEFANYAGINRSYLYRFRELVAELSAYGRETQPHKSRRGVGIKKLDAKKQAIDERVRREHLAWAKELPQLRRQVEEQRNLAQQAQASEEAMAARVSLLERALEYLLLLAHEAGVSLRDMDLIREKVGATVQGQLLYAESAPGPDELEASGEGDYRHFQAGGMHENAYSSRC